MRKFLSLALLCFALSGTLLMGACDGKPDNVTNPDQHTVCQNKDGDHLCDECGETLSACKDENKDHLCDICDKTLSECDYNNASGACAVCGKTAADDLEFLEVEGGYRVTNYAGSSNEITHLEIPATYNGKPVVEIGQNAFTALSSLKTISVPDSVRVVGMRAFQYSTALEYTVLDNVKYIGNDENPYVVAMGSTAPTQSELKIHKNCRAIYQNAFYDCTPTVLSMPVVKSSAAFFLTDEAAANVTKITITAGETWGRDSSMEKYTALSELTLAASVQRIAEQVFYKCENLEKVYWLGDLLGWLTMDFVESTSTPLVYGADLYVQGALLEEVVWPSHLTQVGDYVFYGCSSIEKVVIGDTVTKIGKLAFAECSSLSEISVSNSVIQKDEYSYNPFANSAIQKATVPFLFLEDLVSCRNTLEEVTLTNGSVLKKYAFNGFPRLRKVCLPPTLTEMEDSVFWSCPSLQFNEKGGVAYLGNGETDYFAAMYMSNWSQSEVTIDNGCRFIYSYAFDSMHSLKSITLGVSVQQIGMGAFCNCSNLQTIKIPQSVTNIKDDAFAGCLSLENVYIESIKAWCEIDFGLDGTGTPFYGSGDAIQTKLYLNNALVTVLEIPEGVETIPLRAFFRVRSLTAVVLPASIQSLTRLCFARSENITTITFKGTSAEWESVEKTSLWDSNIKEYEILYAPS